MIEIFLDSSVLIAASGSIEGASFFIVQSAKKNHWQLLTSQYCLAEVERNIGKLGSSAKMSWEKSIRSSVDVMPNVLSISKPLMLEASKDKPVLIGAIAAHAKFLLTLDRFDFKRILNTSVYGVEVLTPGNFLEKQRREKRLKE